MEYGFGRLFVVGITGGIGAGKSTMAQAFRNRGWVTLDTDAMAHGILERPDAGLKEALESMVGPAVLTSSGAVDRRALGEAVFASPELRRRLEGAMHPAIEREMLRRMEDLVARGAERVALEIPLLVEAGWDKKVDFVVAVEAPEEVRAVRASQRLGIAVERVQERMKAQACDEQRRLVAHLLVTNCGSVANALAEMEAAVDQVEESFRIWKAQ